MRYSSKDVSFFLVNGLDVVGTLTEFEDKREAKIERSDGLGREWEEHSFTGVRQAEITQSGFYDDAVGSVHDVLSSGPGATSVLCYCLEGTATGAEFVAWTGAVQVGYQRTAERDGLTKAKATYKNGDTVEQGEVLHTYKAVGATGKTGFIDLGATSTGLAGYLHYNASAGEANVRIMHSASAGTASYSALITFTRTASGHGAERIYATGDVKRYVCADFTTATATGAIAALNAFVGIVR
jgi:hypothetical protein